MKRIALLIALIPAMAFASLTGVDDLKPNIPDETQEKIDHAVMTYYQEPSVEKVNTVLDILSSSDLLKKKTAWAPMVGFLTVVFAANKDHVMQWMSRNDYNDYAIDVIVTSLMHAKLKESALVFAQAEQWKGDDMERLRAMDDTLDLKHLRITVPGHIDTLWGAFFGSGDPVYLNEIIGTLFVKPAVTEKEMEVTPPADVLDENKKLAQFTLREYAATHEAVRKAILARMKSDKDPAHKKLLDELLPKMTPIPKPANSK